MKLSDIVNINEKFQTSVNLKFDIDKKNKVREFIPSRSTVNILEEYLRDIFETETSKSSLIVGAYGKGKSHLLLVLLNLLMNRREDGWSDVINELIQKISKVKLGKNSEEKAAAAGIREWLDRGYRYLPVIISFGKDSLESSYLIALKQALYKYGLSDIMPSSQYTEAVKRIEQWKADYKETYELFKKEILQRNFGVQSFMQGLSDSNEKILKIFCEIYPKLTAGSRFEPLLTSDVPEVYKEVAEELKKKGYRGIIIVFDEFSKFIEGESNSEVSKDMNLVQAMCEVCNASKEPDIRHIFVAHKSIKEYGKNLSREVLNSFKGVEGRLEEKVFFTNEQNYFELMMNVIAKDSKKFEKYISENKLNLEDVAEKTYKLLDFYTLFDLKDYTDIVVKGCFPLTPIAVFLLMKISERVGQNERTVFTFLAKDEANSLVRYISGHKMGQQIYAGADIVFDYFQNQFTKDINNERFYKENIKASYMIKQLDENEAGYINMVKLIKCIALINMINSQEMRANDVYLKYAAGFEEEEYKASIKQLMDKGMVVYRTRQDAYAFRINTDINIDEKIKEIVNEKYKKINLCNVLCDISELKYEFPKKYNNEKAMTRYFAYKFMTINQFEKLPSAQMLFDETEDGAMFSDGKLIVIIDEKCDSKNKDIAADKIARLSDERIVAIYPKEKLLIERSVKKYLAVCELKKDEQFLKEYETASEELNFYQDDILYEINTMLEENYLPVSDGAEYIFFDGDKVVKSQFTDRHELQEKLSDILGRYYSKTPRINHELINRRNISPQIRRARIEIIDRILSGEEELVDEWISGGKSAEATIYRAAFKYTGIVSEGDTEDKNISEILEIINDFITSSIGQKKKFSELYDRIQGKNYGMRNGVIAIYIAWCISKIEGIPLIYEGGLEQEVSAVNLSDIEKNPNVFELFIESEDGEKIEYIYNLERLFGITREHKDNKLDYLKNLVDAMQEWYRELTFYGRYASVYKISEEEEKIVKNAKMAKQKMADNFRRSLGKEINRPRDYIFEELPKITKENDFAKCFKKIKEYKEKIDDMQKELVRELVAEVKEIFGCVEKDASLGSALKEWGDSNAHEMIMGTTATNLLQFIASNESNDEEKILDKLSFIVTGIHIRDYRDTSAYDFLLKLKNIVSEIENISDRNIENAVSFTLNMADGKEVQCKVEETEDIYTTFLTNAIMEAVEETGGALEKSQKVNAILKVLSDVIGG